MTAKKPQSNQKELPFEEVHISDGGVRSAYARYADWMHSTPADVLMRKHS